MTETPPRRPRHQRPIGMLGAIAAVGALGLAAPAAVATACPEHDGGSDSSSSDTAGEKSSPAGGQAAKSKAVNKVSKSNAGRTASNKGGASNPLCADGTAGSSSGPCNAGH